jgi:hypothetical protein
MLLALDKAGYPRGDMLVALSSISAAQALALEAVSNLRRSQIAELSELIRRREKEKRR